MTHQRKEIESIVRTSLGEVAATTEAKLVADLKGDTRLLDSGLDSLGFAMLVADLEEKLGYDPFATSETATYPTTLDEFVDFYVGNQPNE